MSTRPRYTDEYLQEIFERTRGKCSLCHKQLAFGNYSQAGKRGAWHVDHSRPLARGGTHHRNNLRAACISCNYDKGTRSSRAARSANGKGRPPLSKVGYDQARTANAIGVGAAASAFGALVGGPAGALIGCLAGMAIGHDIDPDR